MNERTYPENFVRTPIKGLRQRLRLALRESGATGKFGTDVMRDGTLRVKGEISNMTLTTSRAVKLFT